MEKAIIKINLQGYTELKLLLNAASKDISSRKALTCVYYSPEDKQAVCTDGHILRLLDADLGDKELLITPDSFTLSESQFKKVYDIGKDNPDKVVDYGVKSDEDYLPYPNYKNVIPCEDRITPINNVAIDFNLLARLHKTFPKSKFLNLSLFFTSKLGAVLIYSQLDHKLCGIVMPSTQSAELDDLSEKHFNLYKKSLLNDESDDDDDLLN